MEIKFVRSKVKKVLAAMGELEPSIDNLMDLMICPRSNIGCLLGEKLTISDIRLLKNLGTYFLVAAYNLSQNQIYSKHSFGNTEGVTNQKTYQSFWNTIANMGCMPKGSTNIGGLRPLWIDIEHVLNETCMELFIEGTEFYN
jgi:hypothetical protein